MELFGRAQALQEVVDRLDTRRLVTLVGPAGVGKTALARQAAQRTADRYPLGSRFIDLTRVDDPGATPGAIAAQLGFSSFDALLHAPSEQPALVVLDNCEHVIDAAADAVDQLLDACLAPTVLATSRAPLDVAAESLVLLAPLTVPPVGSHAPIDRENPALALFLARATDAGTALDDDQLVAATELCRRLDGLPLAIELAAARTRVLRPAEILTRLDAGTDVLVRPGFRGAARHRSLDATLEWSHRLLPPAAADVLQCLAIIPGAIPSPLGCSVATDAGLDESGALEALHQLVDASFLTAEPSGDTTLFTMLQTVRAFALRQLAERGAESEAAVRRRSGDHVLDAAGELLANGGRRWDLATFARLHALYEPIASTLRWCLDHDEEPSRALPLCAVLWGVVHQGHTEEISALAEATLERWPDPTLPRAADAAATAATARALLGDHRGAIALAEQHLTGTALADAHPASVAHLTLRRAVGYAAFALDDPARAEAMFTEVSDRARATGQLALALEADVTRAQLLAGRDLDGALALADAVSAEARQTGSTINEVWARTVASQLRVHRQLSRGGPLPAAGRPEPDPVAEVRSTLTTARDLDYPAALSLGLRTLAWAGTRTGDHQGAAAALLEAIEGVAARRGVADLRGVLHATADLLHDAGDERWAAVAATSRSLPRAGLAASAVDDLVHLPDTGGAPVLSRRDVVALARTALGPIATGTAPPPEPSGPFHPDRPPAANRFVAAGDQVAITFAGRSIHLRTSKGLVDLARLLAQPDREVSCLDLMGARVAEAATGATVDDEARRRYEERIRELQAEIDEAEGFHDTGRADTAQAELDALVDHLTAALGLGGRHRRTGGSAEKARSAVTQRIRSTIRRVAAQHPELGRHLTTSITTGNWCAYRPEHPVHWEVADDHRR